MGRVYAVEPKDGERSGVGFRVDHPTLVWGGPPNAPAVGAWGELTNVTRVEFDGDADEGPAWVEAFVETKDGLLVQSAEFRGQPVTVRFRAYVRVSEIAGVSVVEGSP